MEHQPDGESHGPAFDGAAADDPPARDDAGGDAPASAGGDEAASAAGEAAASGEPTEAAEAGAAAARGDAPDGDAAQDAEAEAAAARGDAPDGDAAQDAEAEAADREGAYELLRRGQALLRDRHHAQAAIVLGRAARIEPGKASILEALARAYYNSGQTQLAAEAFSALLEVDPSAHYGHFGLGLSFKRLGRRREARTHLRLAVALDPRSPLYRRALERLGPS